METNEKTPEKDKTFTKCSLNSCVENNNPTVKCSKCNRLVHYKCTELPIYELERYTKPKKPCQYKCRGCVDVPKDLHAMLSKYIEEDQTQELDILSNTMSEMNLFDSKDQLEKSRQEIQALKQELNKCEKTIQTYRENEVALNVTIQKLRASAASQEQKMKITTDHALVKNLEDSLDDKLEKIGKVLKNTLLGTLKESLTHEIQEIKESNRKTEQKLEEASKTYASVLTRKSGNECTSETSDIKTILTQARNEEKSEERERNLRSTNIILHGVDDVNADDEQAKKKDTEFINNFLKVVDESVIPKTISRLGKHDTNKSRPIKVILRNDEDKDKIMRNLSKLKGNETFNGIRITEDYTIEERKLVRSWVDKAKRKNEEEPNDSKIVWTVRGTPKNGLRFWWMYKNPPANNQ